MEEITEDNGVFQGFDPQDDAFEGTRVKLQKLNAVTTFWERETTSEFPEVDEMMEDESLSVLQKSEATLTEKMEKIKSSVIDMQRNTERCIQILQKIEDSLRTAATEEQVVLENCSTTTTAGDSEIIDAGEISSGNHQDNETSDAGDGCSSTGEGGREGQDWTPSACPPEEDLRINVSGFWLSPSNSRWFNINWDEEYTQNQYRKFACKKCSMVIENKVRIQDHVWVSHFGGRFKCLYCSNDERALTRRYSIGHHVRTRHPEVALSMNRRGD